MRRREREGLERRVDRKRTEEEVRRYAAELHEQIRKARAGLTGAEQARPAAPIVRSS